ncbi:hypothetical protein AJ78_04331 [Emergomyces pasteurianus Ep9510]|uniref:Uncharacterized protein n=1 Tax=Emergomyces pasteurianus Ep9510 TaxID=1447872 RepID=A0A1J9QGV0_9EURO|nr:hypothetical protein AJ78_04331 [Emergomyces pasteurianus Ep9510]
MNCSFHTITSDIDFPDSPAASNSSSSQLSHTNERIHPIPAFYLYRPNGVAVPLIALDELPPWLRIGREDWYSSEWQRYMSPVNEQPTIQVGEYEVFARWGGTMYQLPIWRVGGVQRDEYGDGAGGVSEVERKGTIGGKGIYHLGQGGEDGHMSDIDIIDNGFLDGAERSTELTGGGMSGNGNAAGGRDREHTTHNGVNPEGIAQDDLTTPSLSSTHLDNNICDDGGHDGFSYFDFPLSSINHDRQYPHQPQDQQYSPPGQQEAMSSTLPTSPLQHSRSLSNNSCSSADHNHLYSLTSDTTETSVSSLSSSDIPHVVFQLPTLPRVPLGLTKSAPPRFALNISNWQFPPWLENSAAGEGSVCSV